MPNEVIIEAFALAIAKAEGFFVSGSLPERNNNPGALTNSAGIVRSFQTIEDGWNALKRQISAMLLGTSSYYTPQMTIQELAVIYTGGDNPEAWARIVSESLGVSVDTRLNSLGVTYA